MAGGWLSDRLVPEDQEQVPQVVEVPACEAILRVEHHAKQVQRRGQDAAALAEQVAACEVQHELDSQQQDRERVGEEYAQPGRGEVAVG